MSGQIIIWDLDNCLSDDRARIPLIRWHEKDPDARYFAYHAACGDDPPANLNIFAALHDKLGCPDPVFFTARPEWARDATEAWLNRHIKPLCARGLNSGQLVMRPDNDHSSSLELKRKMLAQFFREHGHHVTVVAAYDDRAEVVAMYNENGVPASQLLVHGVCAYTPPACPQDELGPQRPEFDALFKLLDAPIVDDPETHTQAARNMRRALDTHLERNATYGGAYQEFGRVLSALFPHGLQIERGDADTFARLGVYVMLVGKVQRYGQALTAGGHADSAHDAIVYSAMLEELTAERRL